MPTTRQTLRSLVLPTYLPVILSALTTGMLVPVLPLYLTDTGLALGQASLVLSAAGIGGVVGSLPAGWSIGRVGEHRTLLLALVIVGATTAVLGVTDAAIALVLLRVAFGLGFASVRLTRQTFVARRVPAAQRGRALSLIGGSFRLAFLVGPLLGGFIAEAYGYQVTFIVAATISLFALVPATQSNRTVLALLPVVADAQHRSLGLSDGIRTHWRRLLWVGMFPMLVMAARDGRFVVIPFIADDLGVSPRQIGLLVAVSTGADLALFPAAGWIMDRFGRLRAMLPAFSLMSAGLFILAAATSADGVLLAGVVIGVGNGLSAGCLLTLGSDLAPADSPGPFLAGLSMLQGLGGVVGPLIVGLVGEAFGLAGAAAALAIVLIVALVYLVAVIGETSTYG